MTPVTRNILIALGIVAALCLVAHVVARQAALRYGQDLALASGSFTIETLAKPDEFGKILDAGNLSKHIQTIRMTWVFGAAYLRKIENLKAALLYLSENAALPKEQRFKDPEKNRLLETDSVKDDDEFIKDRAFDLVKTFVETN